QAQLGRYLDPGLLGIGWRVAARRGLVVPPGPFKLSGGGAQLTREQRCPAAINSRLGHGRAQFLDTGRDLVVATRRRRGRAVEDAPGLFPVSLVPRALREREPQFGGRVEERADVAFDVAERQQGLDGGPRVVHGTIQVTTLAFLSDRLHRDV